MIICGMDYSISAPAVVKAKLDENLDIIDVKYMSFSSTKKNCKLDENLVLNVKKNFRNDMDRFYHLRDNVERFLYSEDAPEYLALEGYALGGMGKVFNLAEATVLAKSMIYDHGTAMRIYTPSAIKKFATGNGSAGKVGMWEMYQAEGQRLLDLSHLEDLKNPQEDLIDAYWIMKLLQTELKLRHGLMELRDMNTKRIEVFNAVSKSQPQNLLVRDFLKKY